MNAMNRGTRNAQIVGKISSFILVGSRGWVERVGDSHPLRDFIRDDSGFIRDGSVFNFENVSKVDSKGHIVCKLVGIGATERPIELTFEQYGRGVHNQFTVDLYFERHGLRPLEREHHSFAVLLFEQVAVPAHCTGYGPELIADYFGESHVVRDTKVIGIHCDQAVDRR